jgi:hypothetical protein
LLEQRKGPQLSLEEKTGFAVLSPRRMALRGGRGNLPANQSLVLLTDELLRPSFQQAWVDDALRALSKQAVVHVVVPTVDNNEEPTLTRDDEAALSSLAAAHHGILARVHGFPVEVKPLVPVALGLVRPVQLDHVRLVGLPTTDIEQPTVLHEGDGFRFMQALPKSVERVVVEGKLWGDAFRRVVRVDDRFSHATAAFVFGEDEHGVLSEAEMMRVALFGKAVSPVTSYLAIDGGADARWRQWVWLWWAGHARHWARWRWWRPTSSRPARPRRRHGLRRRARRPARHPRCRHHVC